MVHTGGSFTSRITDAIAQLLLTAKKNLPLDRHHPSSIVMHEFQQNGGLHQIFLHFVLLRDIFLSILSKEREWLSEKKKRQLLENPKRAGW